MSNTEVSIEVQRAAAIEEWIEALESGKYEQTKESLQDSNGFCCLGVRCDLQVNNGIGSWDDGVYYPGSEDHLLNKVDTDLPDEDRKFLFGGRFTNSADTKTFENHLIQLNDDERWTFSEIAQEIRRVLVNGEAIKKPS